MEYPTGELECKAQNEENRLRAQFQTSLQETVENEERRVKEACSSMSKHKLEGSTRHLDDLAFEHRDHACSDLPSL